MINFAYSIEEILKYAKFNKESDKIEFDIKVNEYVAEAILKERVKTLRLALDDQFPFFKDLNEARQNVLIEMAYQLGLFGLIKFKKTLRHLQYKEYVEASKEMLNSLWAKQTPVRAKKLSKIMESGNE